jgi:hypothetical protein
MSVPIVEGWEQVGDLRSVLTEQNRYWKSQKRLLSKVETIASAAIV